MTTQLIGGSPSTLDALTVSGATTLATVTTSSLATNALTGLTITSSQVTPLPAAGTLMSYTHGLGVAPASAEFEIVCLTAENGYSIGDVVYPYMQASGTNYSPFSVKKNATVVSVVSGVSAPFTINHATTGGPVAPTSANWAYRFKVRTS
jgi:hypothetical protein